MQQVRSKKQFGQHFLKDENVAKRIADSLQLRNLYSYILEIGPGMGILSQFLLTQDGRTHLIEIDTEAVDYLQKKFPAHTGQILSGDFLRLNLETLFDGPFAVIGNFPYNISSQIMFKVLEHKDRIPEVVGMFQKEVAERIASGPGNRDYGILSVLMQAWYDVELLFTLDENDFSPPPKVKSAVLRFVRREEHLLQCDPKKFLNVVKTAFNQRRKTLRNSLKGLTQGKELPYLDLRAEALHWTQFEELTNLLEKQK
jgi:16S rRNA (adenine1518-N6/adenine1519-N6)-dimethyltransferase